jgi:metallo-beta-lactamase family protein
MGRPGTPILRDPTSFKEADYVVIESTYGDRLHEPESATIAKLAEAINWTARAGGNIIIPSFALERSQEVLYYLNRLLLQNAIPHLAVFLDSPMAISITELFEQHPELMDAETQALVRTGRSPFDFAGLHLVRTVDESKAINHITGTAIIIAGSGMCTGGRIKHHLVANISRPNSSVLFVGYQANGTLGREIVDGSTEVRILGQDYPVHARIVHFTGFSGHADQKQLLDWLGRFENAPRGVFVTHGEESVSERFAGLVTEKTGWQVSVPDYGETAELE